MSSTVAFQTCSAIVAFLNIAPFCWQVEHRNSGVASLGFWVIVLNLVNFINAYIWRNDAIDRAPVLCDIFSRIVLAAPIGVICANLCIMRFLAQVVSSTRPTSNGRRRREIADYVFCLLVPVVLVALHTLTAPARYGIAQGLGCTNTWTLSWVTYVSYIVWLPLLSFVGCLYSVYTIYRLVSHRREFNKMVSHSHSALTISRLLRLSALGVASICFNTVLSIASAQSIIRGANGYIDYDWTYIHRAYSKLLYDPFYKLTLANWGSVIAGILVLIFFGFGNEALLYYQKLGNILGLTSLLRCATRSTSDGRTSSDAAESHSTRSYALHALPRSTTKDLSESDEEIKTQATSPYNVIYKSDRSPQLGCGFEGRIRVTREEEVV